MKHHFGDFLDREGDYWTVVPNRERFTYRIGDVPVGSEETRIATIGSEDTSWRNVFTFPNLEELTLHNPSHEQLQAISELSLLKRLRITHARPRELAFISSLSHIEELVLEYVSGFSDLSPLRSLSRLKSLHIENLRKVSDFGGLSGLANLKFQHGARESCCAASSLRSSTPIPDPVTFNVKLNRVAPRCLPLQ